MSSLSITSDPEVQGGALCFAGTRVTLRAVFAFFERGDGPEEVQREYPGLSLVTLEAAFALYWDFCRRASPPVEGA